jgi:hypothetical protein
MATENLRKKIDKKHIKLDDNSGIVLAVMFNRT